MRKNEYHHGNLKEEFLKIAFDFIAKEDIDKLTLKILSDATGTSRSAIYKHFVSKDALIENIIVDGFEQFDTIISSILEDKNTPLIDRFYLGGKKYIEFAKENPNLYKLLYGKKYAHIREEVVNIKDDNCSGFGVLKLSIEEGQESGILKKESSFEQAIIIWSGLHGLSSLIIDGFMDVEDIYERLYDNLFKTLIAGVITNKVRLISSLPFGENVLKPKSAV